MNELFPRTLPAGVEELAGDSAEFSSRSFPRWPEREVPVGDVTNGVHVPSWDSRSADRIWTSACGKGRWLSTLETLTPLIEELDDEMLRTRVGAAS